MKDWKIGDSIPSPVGKMISVDPQQVDQKSIYKLMIGAVVPRPIAFVSTISPQGVGNLAPFSFFNAIASNPPSLMISVTRRSDGEKKDTLRNIEDTGQFVVNTLSEWLVGAANQCSAEYPYGVDEMQKVGLTPLPSEKIKPARVKEAAIQMECELYNMMPVGDGSVGSSVIVVGKIVMVHVHAAAYDHGRIVIEELHAVSRLAGASYGKIGEIFDLPRPG